ncbi:MAG TPA: glycoside hydrolase family 27 protein [Chitinophagaceae bacterium]|jgi:hypothetical protein
MKKYFTLFLLLLFFGNNMRAQTQTNEKKSTPVMGWSSWNNFRTDINEQLIKQQADALVTSGMKAAGYTFINIDDGFWGGRDDKGYIIPHPVRFPGGMKNIAAYIHSKGLKAGIYSDAGIHTCASMWDKDTIGSGMGLFGHEFHDLQQMLRDWDYDFIKVDWCGGDAMGLDEEVRYTMIANIIKQIRPGTVYNVCRWQFPGKWVCNIADSWRISGDIDNTFKSILHIIDLNADLWKYAGPGHVNDMDMLQVGRGMTYEEDKTHFSMWCMMASPLLAGNDLSHMSEETISILTNKEMIAIDQDALVYQARKLQDYGEQEVWARPLVHTMSGKVAVALLNRSDAAAGIALTIDSVGLDAAKGYIIHDVWTKKTSGKEVKQELNFTVPPHGIIVLTITGVSLPFNIYQKK